MDGNHEDFLGRLDSLVEGKEESLAEVRQQDEGSTKDCYRILSDLVTPFFNQIENRIEQAKLDVRVRSKEVPRAAADYLRIEDIESGDPVAPDLICACDIESKTIRLDIGEAEDYDYSFELSEISNGTREFRQRAKGTSYSYQSFDSETLERLTELYLEVFL